jgi:hypothetical protein
MRNDGESEFYVDEEYSYKENRECNYGGQGGKEDDGNGEHKEEWEQNGVAE